MIKFWYGLRIPEDKLYAGNLENLLKEDVITKMMSEYRNKDRKYWFIELKAIKNVIESCDDPTKKYPGFVHLKFSSLIFSVLKTKLKFINYFPRFYRVNVLTSFYL